MKIPRIHINSNDKTFNVGDLVKILRDTVYYEVGTRGCIHQVFPDSKQCFVDVAVTGGTYQIPYYDLELVE